MEQPFEKSHDLHYITTRISCAVRAHYNNVYRGQKLLLPELVADFETARSNK